MEIDQLSPYFLIAAYSQGFFPMADSQTNEIHWLNPDPRAVIPLDGFHVSRSFARFLKKNPFQITFDKAFNEVIAGCANRPETWISPDIKKAYMELHRLGFATSVEVWRDKDLVGGLYGVCIERAFFAESMFSREPNASKAALFYLLKYLNDKGFTLLEVQFVTPHLRSLGAVEIPEAEYLKRLQQALGKQRQIR
ncbi:MAG: leucyl/phenylalanyl-tRNA--protein transferase [Oligoflexales bacterium]